MTSINIRVNFSDQQIHPQKFDTLTKEGGLIYRDEGGDFGAHLITLKKFAMLTAASPLIAIARIVRSIVFPFILGDMNRAGREFIGGLATPLIASFCFVGSLASSIVYGISSNEVSFYVAMRRIYAHFDAWINQIDLNDSSLPTYSRRVSTCIDCIGNSDSPYSYVWTTAPCMQPVLEKGYSGKGGLLDPARLKKIYPFLPIDRVSAEKDGIIIESHYVDKNICYTACNGVFEHQVLSKTCCCCYRVESVYDRFLCCEASRGTCSSIENPDSFCQIVSCNAGCIGVCCCEIVEDREPVFFNTGCFGPAGLSCVTDWTVCQTS